MNESSAVAKPEVCVVVPIWDSFEQSEYTAAFIGAMCDRVQGNWLLVIVDNASPSPITQEMLEFVTDPRVHVIHNEKNEGYGKAANIGAQYGIEQGCEYVIICNNDIQILHPDWVYSSFVSHLKENPRYFMGARYIADNGLTNFGEGLIPYHEGWCIACTKDAWVELGGFDEGLFAYFEDTDICYRAVKAGYQLIQSPDFLWYSDGNLSCAHFGYGSLFHIGGRTGYADPQRFNWVQVTIDSARYFKNKWGFPKMPIAEWEISNNN